jgi:hypothetical protein
VRDVREYLEKAAEFEALAARAGNAALRQRFADLAAGYRKLAADRERMIAEGAIAPQEGRQTTRGLAPRTRQTR